MVSNVTRFTLEGENWVLVPEAQYKKMMARIEQGAQPKKTTKKGVTKEGAKKTTKPVKKSLKRASSRPPRLSAQDRGDIAESMRALREEESIPAEQVFAALGL
jgi:hypothetical protein